MNSEEKLSLRGSVCQIVSAVLCFCIMQNCVLDTRLPCVCVPPREKLWVSCEQGLCECVSMRELWRILFSVIGNICGTGEGAGERMTAGNLQWSLSGELVLGIPSSVFHCQRTDRCAPGLCV